MSEKDIISEYKKVEKLLAKQKATEALNLILSLRRNISKEKTWFVAKSYFWETLCYKHLGDKEKALISAKTGITLFRNIGEFVESSKMLRDIGLVYEYSEMYDNSLEYLFKSIDELRDNDVIDALGVTFSKIGQVLIKKNDLKQALYYSELGYYICNEGKNIFFLITSMLPLTMLYYKLNMYDEGLEKINDLENLLAQMNKNNKYDNERREGEIMFRKALLLMGLNKLSESIKSYKIFLKKCLVKSVDKNFFINTPEYKELLDYYDKHNKIKYLSDYCKKDLNIDFKSISNTLN